MLNLIFKYIFYSNFCINLNLFFYWKNLWEKTSEKFSSEKCINKVAHAVF